MVAWGHFVGTGSYAVDIPGIFLETLERPLIPMDTHKLWKLEEFLYSKLGVQVAVIGVVIFFVISGYFIPDLKKRMNNNRFLELLWNRMIKLYPMIFLCVAVNAILVAISQGIIYTPSQYISTALCISVVLGETVTVGVLWYLNVLFFVYFMCSIFSEISIENMFKIYMMLIVFVILPRFCDDVLLLRYASGIAYLARISTICFLGIVLKLVEVYDNKIERIVGVLFFNILTIFILRMYESNTGMMETYDNPVTYIIAFLVIMLAKLLGRKMNNSKHSENGHRVIRFLINISLPFYMLHVTVGLVLIYYLRILNVNAYMCVLLAYIVSGIVSYSMCILCKYLMKNWTIVKCIFRKNCASVPEERSAIPLETEQSSAS